MGGYGSGVGLGETARDTTDVRNPISVTRLRRDGALTPGRRSTLRWSRGGRPCGFIAVEAEADRLVLDYRRGGTPMRYAVGLDRTPCHFGGSRMWLLCPADGCGRRVAVLYGGGPMFVCRTCARLVYLNTRENWLDAAGRRVERARRRLGWEEGALNPPGERRKGMHRHTYWQLLDEYADAQTAFLGAIVRQFDLDV